MFDCTTSFSLSLGKFVNSDCFAIIIQYKFANLAKNAPKVSVSLKSCSLK